MTIRTPTIKTPTTRRPRTRTPGFADRVERVAAPVATDPPAARVPPWLAVTVGNGVALAAGMLTGVVGARVLGPGLRGEFLATQTFATLAAVLLTLGVTQAVVTCGCDDADLARPLLAQTLGALAVGVTLFLGLRASGTQPWLTGRAIVGAAAATAGGVAVSLSSGMAQRRGRMTVEFQLVRILPPLAGTAGLILAWRLAGGELDTWLLLSGLGVFIAGLAGLVHTIGSRAGLLAARRSRFPAGLAREARAAFATVVGAQIVYRLDSVVVAVVLAPTQVAYYGVAVTVSQCCATLGQSAGMIAFSRLRQVTDPAARGVLVRRAVAGAIGVTTAVALPTLVIVPDLIRWLYGSGFLPAVAPTRVLTVAAIPLSVDYLLIHILLGIRGERAVYRTQTLVGAITVIALCAATARHDLVLVAMVSVVTYTVSASLLLWAALRRTATRAGTRPIDGPVDGRVGMSAEGAG
ncbi:MAG: lipopolysaccharide biosynthesis protein [Frankia sp.]